MERRHAIIIEYDCRVRHTSMSDNIYFTIRYASSCDAEVLSALGRRTFLEAFGHLIPTAAMDEYLNEVFDLSRVAGELEDPQTLFIIAEDAGAPVGYAKLYWGSTDVSITGPNPIKLWRLYSLTDYLSKGVGAILMSKSIELACDRGYGTLWLTVNIGNARAIAFYQRFGFVVTGKSGFLLGGVPQQDHVMELPLDHGGF